MSSSPVIVCLPIADRPTSFAFYRDGLGLSAVGEPADDGIPEPLQFVLTDGLRIMLIPTSGFGWIIGDHQVAARGTSECVLSLTAQSPADVEEIVTRASRAGARIVTAPAQQPWGFVGTFADPDGHLWMVTAPPSPA